MQRIFSVTLLLCVILTASLSAQENNDAKKLYNEGNAKLKSGDFAGAVQLYDKALALEKHQYFYYQRGIALSKEGKEQDALESFQASVKIAPNFAPGYNALGGRYFALKEYDKSIESYQKALKENPALTPAKKGLSAALTAKANELITGGELEKAAKTAQQAIDTDPTYATAYLILAKAHNKSGKYKEAVDAGEKALKNMRTSKGAAYFEIGLAQRNLGNKTEAKKAFLEAKKDPAYARSADYELKNLKESK